MFERLRVLARLPGRYYIFGSLGIVVFCAAVIHAQVLDRYGFSRGELHRDVVDRWGAPVVQVAPSVRYVESGTVFNTLSPLPLDAQDVRVDAVMNFRKRGLVYFSGFDFDFRGRYAVANPHAHAIDLIFIFPLEIERRSLLSDLAFTVDGQPAVLPLSKEADKLTWTGRLAGGEQLDFEIRFRGRGLDEFTYRPDPDLPVRNLVFEAALEGGEDFDYGHGVLPAHEVVVEGERVDLRWEFESLESGFPVGVILPSEASFDDIILVMARRAWAPFLILLAVVWGVALQRGRSLSRVDCYLLAAGYGFFFVLLPYLAAYMNFYVAYAVALTLIGVLLRYHIRRCTGMDGRNGLASGAIAALLGLPTFAVVLQGHTGLIYALEILAGLALAMVLSNRAEFRSLLERLETDLEPKEPTDVPA